MTTTLVLATVAAAALTSTAARTGLNPTMQIAATVKSFKKPVAQKPPHYVRNDD